MVGQQRNASLPVDGSLITRPSTVGFGITTTMVERQHFLFAALALALCASACGRPSEIEQPEQNHAKQLHAELKIDPIAAIPVPPSDSPPLLPLAMEGERVSSDPPPWVGTANTVCGLMNAYRDNVPLLLMVGRTPITQRGHIASRSAPIPGWKPAWRKGRSISSGSSLPPRRPNARVRSLRRRRASSTTSRGRG